MKIFKNPFIKNKKKIDTKKFLTNKIDQYIEIGKLVKAARIEKNISTKELSLLSKIPEYVINAIENNIEKNRPKYPFIRSILSKLEECLELNKNTLLELLVKETKHSKKARKKFIIRKYDFINTWQGSIIYFFILVLILILLKRDFFSDVNIIEIQNIDEKINRK